MDFIIVTGMSGAGKSTALKFLEDLGFFCADNLPPELIPKFAEICFRPGTDIDKVALGVDIRGGRLFDDLFAVLSSGELNDYDYKILFLDASDEVLIKRFKETRRSHPLAKNDLVSVGIEKERVLLSELRSRATYIVDTSYALTRQLREKIVELFVTDKQYRGIMITVVSFGYKFGIPPGCDLVFDVRFLPNPFYIAALKEQTGSDKDVKDYVLGFEESHIFLNKLKDMLEFLIPLYIKEGKNQLVIGIGCTGGKHRSVALANEIAGTLQSEEHSVIVIHSDIKK